LGCASQKWLLIPQERSTRGKSDISFALAAKVGRSGWRELLEMSAGAAFGVMGRARRHRQASV